MDRVGLWTEWDYGQSRIMGRVGRQLWDYGQSGIMGRVGLWAEWDYGQCGYIFTCSNGPH